MSHDYRTTGIKNPCIARRLLRRGNSVVDIKANRSCKERTVFFFELTDKLVADLAQINFELGKAALARQDINSNQDCACATETPTLF